MKTSTGTLVMLGAVLLAGPALAQSATLNSSGATIAVETRAAPRGGPSVAPGSTSGEPRTGGERLRLINNSETDTVQVEGSYRAVSGEAPVNGIGGLGGGRYSQEAAVVTGRVTNAQGQPETAQAQSRDGPVNGIGGSGGGRLPNRDHIDQDAQSDTPGRSSQGQAAGSTSRGSALTEVSSSQGADFIARTNTDRPSPGARRPAPGAVPEAAINSSGGPIDIESWSWGRIDRLNTAEACTARRGVVLMHEGVQQCRLPATSRPEGAVRP
ncbi:MAG: hypothetical protein PSV23_15290 [Brevundimonas sp.]|uniref:hypothetical protein n=1 Tax=Brevundimonas sp. TaxID=1871086 RepID=UPI00248718B9|nr:hypothetical protein [Brevundimonas sp.]MDI1328156.1 hypothetical protein [Brevundimonas sp.]